MNILITNVEMDGYSGTTLYVKELALGLQKRGHTIEVYTMRIGPIGKELLEHDIHVTTSMKKLAKPDIIHAHHNITAWPILRRFSQSPMIFWVHSRLSPLNIPPRHRNIIQYMAVDFNCQERYVTEHGFDPGSVSVIYNWVNLDRFKLKEHTASTLKTALVFSNYASDQSGYLPVIRSACKQLGIRLDVMGQGTHSEQNDPENYLGNYDLVFAKAKAAMEAMACGCAVVICDFTGLAGFASPENFDKFRSLNFGMKLMTRPIQPNLIANELEKHTYEDTNKVCNRIRSVADMNLCIGQIHELYLEIAEKHRLGIQGDYGFNLRNFFGWRGASFRIWIGLWAHLKFPLLHSWFKKLKGSTH